MNAVYPQWPSNPYPVPQATGYSGYYGPAYSSSFVATAPSLIQPEPPRTQHPVATQNAELMQLLSTLSQNHPGQTSKTKHEGHAHGDNTLEQSKGVKIAKHLAIAGGMFLFGMLLNNPLMPSRNPLGFKLISPDWKDWAKIIAGIFTVNHINKAFDWKPVPFVSAAESVAVINALSVGFTKGSALQMLFLAPIVGAVVQTASLLNDNVAEPLKEKFGIPTLATKLAISAGSIGMGLYAYPKALWLISKMGFMGAKSQAMAIKHSLSGLMGKTIQKSAITMAQTGKYGRNIQQMAAIIAKGGPQAQKLQQELSHNVGKLVLTAEGAICSRGCCNFMLCLSEIGEMVSAYFNRGKKNSKSEENRSYLS